MYTLMGMLICDTGNAGNDLSFGAIGATAGATVFFEPLQESKKRKQTGKKYIKFRRLEVIVCIYQSTNLHHSMQTCLWNYQKQAEI